MIKIIVDDKNFAAMKPYPNILSIIVIALLLSCSDSKDELIIEPAVYTISGTISGDDVSGINVSNGLVSVQTDAEGKFIFNDIDSGPYTITPIDIDLSFAPFSIDVVVVTENISEIDFQALSTIDIFFENQVWTPFNDDVYEIVTLDDHELKLELTSNAIWYQNGQAGLVYTSVEGDFTISSLVTANKTSNGEELDCNVCLGGLMARNPDNTSGENYVHIVTGFTPDGLGVETKNTINSVSDYTPTNDGSATYYLQIKRVGSTFTLSKKAVGTENWVVAATYERTDLPSTLQVGFNIYTSLNGAEVADLSVAFREITLE